MKKNCLNCGEEFNALASEVKRGNAKFCKLKCAAEFNGKSRPKPEPNVECAWCQTKFYKNTSEKKTSKSGLFFCKRGCKDRAQALDGLKELHLPHFGTGIHCYREIAFRNKPKKCERCGYDKNEKGIVVHHKDRDRQNNSIENLEVLCAICHLIEHYDEDVSLNLHQLE